MIISNFALKRKDKEIDSFGGWEVGKPEITTFTLQTQTKLDLDFEKTVKMEGVWARETHGLGYFCLLKFLNFRALIMKN